MTSTRWPAIMARPVGPQGGQGNAGLSLQLRPGGMSDIASGSVVHRLLHKALREGLGTAIAAAQQRA